MLDQPPPPGTPCTPDTCPVDWSILTYRPSVAANAFFLAAFAVLCLVHLFLGIRWRSWGFMTGIILGCLSSAIGYVGRLMLNNNPFSFNAFIIQSVCLTIAPVFFTGSIYVTLSKTVIYFAPDLSRFPPKLFYWIFIPADVVCLVLQAAGGAMSSTGDSNDPESQAAVDLGVSVSLAGLALQVVVLFAFIVTFADYMIRYWRSGRGEAFDWKMKAFFIGLFGSTILILARCAYRVAELKDGYDGDLIHDEASFIAIEGGVVVAAVMLLFFGHPGLVFDRKDYGRKASDTESSIPMSDR